MEIGSIKILEVRLNKHPFLLARVWAIKSGHFGLNQGCQAYFCIISIMVAFKR